MQIEKTLHMIGFTNSETKVYEALLSLRVASKGEILKKAKIAPSKIYHVLDKLIAKGVVSSIIKNNVKHFSAAPVSRIRDFLQQKKEEVVREEKALLHVLPFLEKLQQMPIAETRIEVFLGWKGMETVYTTLIEQASPGDNFYVLGASAGEYSDRTKRFFLRYGLIAHRKGLRGKIIFNEDARAYARSFEKESRIRYEKRFLPRASPVEILIGRLVSAVVILKKEPIILLIHDKETADGFISYFKELWHIASR